VEAWDEALVPRDLSRVLDHVPRVVGGAARREDRHSLLLGEGCLMAGNVGFEEAVLRRIDQMADPMAEAAANMMGMPPGGKKYSQSEIDAEWNWSPMASPQVRVEAMLELKALGKTDEEITDAVYPNRRRLIKTSHPNINEQIKFAKAQNARMAKLEAEYLATQPAALDAPVDTTLAPEAARAAALGQGQSANDELSQLPSATVRVEPGAGLQVQPDQAVGATAPAPMMAPPLAPEPSLLDQPFSPFGG
jgi:hypothetical protein